MRERERGRETSTEEKQREWQTVERGNEGKREVGENRGRWVLAALWRAPGVAPRRFGASNAETLRWCWLHVPTHLNPRRRSLSRYSRTRNYAVAMTVRDSISRMYIHVHFSTFPLALLFRHRVFSLFLCPSLSFSLSLSFSCSVSVRSRTTRDSLLGSRKTPRDGSRINSRFSIQGGQLQRQGPRWTTGCGPVVQNFRTINFRISCTMFSSGNLVFISLNDDLKKYVL